MHRQVNRESVCQTNFSETKHDSLARNANTLCGTHNTAVSRLLGTPSAPVFARRSIWTGSRSGGSSRCWGAHRVAGAWWTAFWLQSCRCWAACMSSIDRCCATARIECFAIVKACCNAESQAWLYRASQHARSVQTESGHRPQCRSSQSPALRQRALWRRGAHDGRVDWEAAVPPQRGKNVEIQVGNTAAGEFVQPSTFAGNAAGQACRCEKREGQPQTAQARSLQLKLVSEVEVCVCAPVPDAGSSYCCCCSQLCYGQASSLQPSLGLCLLTSPYVSQADATRCCAVSTAIVAAVPAGRAAPRALAASAGPSGRRSVRTVLEGAPNPSADSSAAAAACVGSHGRRPLRPRVRADRMTDGPSRAVAAPLPPAAAGAALPAAAKPAGLRVPLRRTDLPLLLGSWGTRWGAASAPEAAAAEVRSESASCGAAECAATGERRAGEAVGPRAGDGRGGRASPAGEAGDGRCWGWELADAGAPVPVSASTPQGARSCGLGVDAPPRLLAAGCCSSAAAAAAGMGRASPAALGETRQGRAREEAPRPRRERARARSRISDVTLEEGAKVAPGGSTNAAAVDAAAAAEGPRGVPDAAAAATPLLAAGLASTRAGAAVGAAAPRGSSHCQWSAAPALEAPGSGEAELSAGGSRPCVLAAGAAALRGLVAVLMAAVQRASAGTKLSPSSIGSSRKGGPARTRASRERPRRERSTGARLRRLAAVRAGTAAAVPAPRPPASAAGCTQAPNPCGEAGSADDACWLAASGLSVVASASATPPTESAAWGACCGSSGDSLSPRVLGRGNTPTRAEPVRGSPSRLGCTSPPPACWNQRDRALGAG